MMKRFLLVGLLALCLIAGPVLAADPTTITYGPYEGSANWFSTHFTEQFGGEANVPVWDLTQGDLVLTYTLDMSKITQPHGLPANPTEWEAYVGPTAKDPKNYPDTYTPWIEVGLRGEGAGDFNPGPFGVYQGQCGGWMVSECDDWVGYWDGDTFVGDGTATQDLDDKHGLQASGGRSELDYDVLKATPDTVDSIPSPYWWYPSPKGAYGSWENHGLWFDRDGVDQWQANSWGNSGENLRRINTGGVYTIEITYHAIDADGDGDKTDDGLGVMFAKINGVQQGFYTSWVSGEPQYYPVGMSFKGDMEHMQVFAGSYAGDPSGWDYGKVYLTDISVTGYAGTSDPLVADFTYTPATVFTGDTVQFTDASHGGMAPYTYKWDFENDGTVDDTTQSPSHSYATAGTYNVKLTVTPFRCVPKTVTKQITVTCAASLDVTKFYDADADGLKDDSEQFITGWPVTISETGYTTPVENLKLPAGTITVSETTAGVWKSTTPTSVEVTLTCGDEKEESFGNLCLGAGGGLTPGFWSNKNGQKLVGEDDLQMLRDLNLKDTRGNDFEPTTYAQLKNWLLKSDASANMAYKLSVMLASMELNVFNEKVDGSYLIYAPGTTSANALGYASVSNVMQEANAALAADSLTPAGDPNRAYQEALKNALDKANNNYNFVQPSPCPITYPED